MTGPPTRKTSGTTSTPDAHHQCDLNDESGNRGTDIRLQGPGQVRSLVEGQLEGDSMALVVRRLREMGYMPISVTPKSAVNLKTEIKIPGISDRVKLREVAVVTRQLSTMVDSGLSVVRSLGILAAQVENPELCQGPERRAARPRARLVALGGLLQAPQGLLAPLLHAGPGRRDRREPGRGPGQPGQTPSRSRPSSTAPSVRP
jgi:hypothetical protein